MESSDMMESTLSAAINADLANANGLICITQFEGTERSKLVEKMANTFKELEENYSTLTAEKKLFLLALALNLRLDGYQTQNSKKQLEYQDKIDDYFPHLKELPLTKLQQAKWCSEFARVHGLVECYTDANDYYEKALKHIELIPKSDDNRSSLKKMQKNLNIQLAKINLQSAFHFESKQPAPDLAYAAYKCVLAAINNAAKLRPSESDKIQLYLMKAQALDKLATQDHQRKPGRATTLWIRALKANVEGLSIVGNSDDQKQFLDQLKSSNKKLLKLVTSSNEKENIKPYVLESIKKIDSWLQETNLEKLDELQQLVGTISRSISSTKSSTPFWEKNNNVRLKESKESSNVLGETKELKP